MAQHHHTPLFSLVVILTSFIFISMAVGEGDGNSASWTQGEAGPPQVTRSSEEVELEDVCRCLSADTYNHAACPKLLNYGPIIRNGTCHGNLSTRSKRGFTRSTRSKRGFTRGDTKFSSPPTFIENIKCLGTKTIILSSSGVERQLTLTTQSSVFICPGSIDTSLQQLNVISVSKIVIAPGAFKARTSDISIRFANVQKIVIPEEAFSVEIMVPVSPMSDPIEMESIFTAPPVVRLDVSTAAMVEFRSRSIVAPIVKLKLTHVKDVLFGSRAIIPYFHPEASSLEVSHSQTVILETQTINTGKFEAKYIKQLLMKEKAVEVVDDDGAGAKVEHVTNMTLLDEALSIGSGADIILNNISLTSAGVRSIRSTGPGNLRRAAFTHVSGKGLPFIAMCIKTETAVVFNLEITGKDETHIGVCIEGQVLHSDTTGVAVVCEQYNITRNICDDPRCAPCVTNAEENPVIVQPVLPFTTMTPTIFVPKREDVSAIIRTIFTASPLTSTAFGYNTSVSIPQEDINTTTSQDLVHHPVLQDSINVSFLSLSEDVNGDANGNSDSSLLQAPIYIFIILVCVVIIFILFVIYLIYKCCTQKKHDKYCLPQENRLSTFRNPRTIMTPENLTSQSNTLNSSDANAPPEVYTTYNSYRQSTATYTVRSDSPTIEGSCCSTENHLPYHEQNLPTGHYQLAPPEPKENLNPPEYQLPSFNSQDLPPRQQDLPMPEDCYLYPEDEVPLDSQFSYDTRLPISEDQLPPPDGYVQSADEQMPTELSLSSGDESSYAESSSPPPDYQLHPPENQWDLRSQDCSSSPVHQSLNENDQVPTNEVPMQSKYTSTQDVEQTVPVNRLSLLNKETSDDDELII